MQRTDSRLHRYWWLCIVLLSSSMIGACSTAPPPPTPTDVLALIRHYPGGVLLHDQLMPPMSGHKTYLVVYRVQTTAEAAIAYYTPHMHDLGLKTRSSRRDSPTFEYLPIERLWMYDGCPFHAVSLSLTRDELHLVYSTGHCG